MALYEHNKRVLTAEEDKWFRENYGKISQNKIAKQLMVSPNTVREIAIRLGLRESSTFRYSSANAPMPTIIEYGNNYCMDCKHYLNGGTCSRNGKMIGALHKKSCFETKELR